MASYLITLPRWGRLSKLLIWKLRGLVGFANLSASINAAINLGFYGNFRIFLSEINPVEYARLRSEWSRGSAPTKTLCTRRAERRGGGGTLKGCNSLFARIRKFRLHLSAPARLGSNDLVVPAGTTTARKHRNRNAPVKGAILRYFKRIRLSSAFQRRIPAGLTEHRVCVCSGIGSISVEQPENYLEFLPSLISLQF
jgi:hypothetical protein